MNNRYHVHSTTNNNRPGSAETSLPPIIYACLKIHSYNQSPHFAQNRDWPATSIQSILRNLEKKNAIRVDAITKLGKAYGRLFCPTLSANEYVAMQFGRYYQNGKLDYASMISSLFGNTSANKEEILEASPS